MRWRAENRIPNKRLANLIAALTQRSQMSKRCTVRRTFRNSKLYARIY